MRHSTRAPSYRRLDRLAAIAELIYFPDDVIAEHERRPAAHRLWVEVPSDHRVRVRQARVGPSSAEFSL
jgi:hypothetical protein